MNAVITQRFGEHAAAIEDVAGVRSENERLTLCGFRKKLGNTRPKLASKRILRFCLERWFAPIAKGIVKASYRLIPESLTTKSVK